MIHILRRIHMALLVTKEHDENNSQVIDMEWDDDDEFFPPEPEIPSREKHKRWIHAFSSVDYRVVDHTKVGKWLLFFDQEDRSDVTGLTQHDYAWQFIKNMTENDILYQAKCSTSSKGTCEAYNKSQTGVICCYTLDYTDKRDVKRAADAIRKAVHFPRNLFYKTDNDTRAGKYTHQGDSHVSIYKHTEAGDLYERDREIKYKWNFIYL